MEYSKQQAFEKLRPPCVNLSSVALKFRGQQASIKNLLLALEAAHAVIIDLGRHDALDEKLAEYAFFPLSTVFNESQKLSSHCLELAVQCLQVLVSRGWRRKLQPEMGKQLLILLSLLAGGSPTRSKDNAPSEELVSTCFECMSTLFDILGQVAQHVFDEIGAKTIVDQSVYLLLEALTGSPSESVQLSAANALQSLLSKISNRILLASLLPRTVSALTKALTPSTQIRRTHKVLVALFELLSHILTDVLADEVALNETASSGSGSEVSMHRPEIAEASLVLDDKWLKATASQVKLALANVVKLHNHDRQEVRHALFKLCLAMCERCLKTLSDSLQLNIETMVMLAGRDGTDSLAQGKQLLKHLILSNSELMDLLRSSLDAWIIALPRVMQGNDDRAKRQVLQQISIALQIVLESGDASDLLNDYLASSLVQSVSIAVDGSQAVSLLRVSEAPSPTQMVQFQEQYHTRSFEPVILDGKGSLNTLVELHALISQMRNSSASESLTRSMMARVGQSSGTQQLSSLWLCLMFLNRDNPSFSISDFLDIPSESYDTTPYLISDLYSITLPLLLGSTTTFSIYDWRIPALALESTILQAKQLGRSYRPELIDTLYPILFLLGSPEPRLQSHAMTALNLLALACEYTNTSTMLVENVDYLINSIALKLNTFDISPQGPQVLLILLRLCGARLIPYLDDLIGSIFAALENFHGYPRLVELLFDVLGVAVDEAAKNPALAITNGMEEPKHRKTAYQPSTMEDILQDIRAHKERKERRDAESLLQPGDDNASQSAPHRPWTSNLDGPETSKKDQETQEAEFDENEEQPFSQAAEEAKESPLTKPHTLLLSIARSTIPHLTSPSPPVRLTLLQLLTRITQILSRHENSFLPLVNDIWPAILPRLFSSASKSTANSGSEQGEPEQDPAYVTIAAADTIAAICVSAGGFMSGRIESIFPSLETLYRRIWSEVEQDRLRIAQHRGPVRRLALSSANDAASLSSPGANLKGTVDLRIVESPPPDPGRTNAPIGSNSNSTTSTTHQLHIQTLTTQTQTSKIHTSLLNLLTTILLHTSMPPISEIGDAILALLSPIMDEPGREHVREALEVWNADAVWVVREIRAMEREMREGRRTVGDWTLRGQGGAKKRRNGG
ncbi:hypothetical protein GJ744_003417 [Endocarpon pusillum]|uniref:HEAT repeat protein n=1 Tax=Endocarpon pusillum TaxID=364733 RepID=A0A8H7A926_9EURO|nr:hypothetical protein GJ744_003417 [Endocarpon pusillum]